MRAALRLVLALLAAIAAPSAIPLVPYAADLIANDASHRDPSAWIRFHHTAVLVLGTASLGVLVLGVPAFFVLRWRKVIRWWSTTLSGFVLGCLPVIVLQWPVEFGRRGSSSHWNGERMVFTEIDGVPTLKGWLSYLQEVVVMGAFGAVAALAFWIVWRSLAPRERVDPTSADTRA